MANDEALLAQLCRKYEPPVICAVQRVAEYRGKTEVCCRFFFAVTVMPNRIIMYIPKAGTVTGNGRVLLSCSMRIY